MIRQPYEIRVEGTLSDAIAEAFLPWRAETDGRDTVIRGLIADQSELGGLLQTIDSLGLVLVEVRPSEDPT